MMSPEGSLRRSCESVLAWRFQRGCRFVLSFLHLCPERRVRKWETLTPRFSRSPFMNFIAGENGSGKSALLTAISFALVSGSHATVVLYSECSPARPRAPG